jgi:hypothetical protein
MSDHNLAIDTITCWLDEDTDITCDAYVVLDDDAQWRFISMSYDACVVWINDNWRDYADPDALAEADYGLA